MVRTRLLAIGASTACSAASEKRGRKAGDGGRGMQGCILVGTQKICCRELMGVHGAHAGHMIRNRGT